MDAASDEIDLLETVLDSLSVGIVALDADHAPVLANRFARRVLPLDAAGGGGKPVWERALDDTVAGFLEKTLRGGDRADGWEYDAVVKGRPRRFSLSLWPLVRERRVKGSLIHLEDVTERRGREARLRRVEALASLTTLAAGVAHEIKNPLGSLSIHVQLIQKTQERLRRDLLDADTDTGAGAPVGAEALLDATQKYLGVINEEIARLNGIVVDFLFAVRPMNLDLRPGDVNAALSDLADFVSCELGEAGVTLVREFGDDLPLIEFDGRCLKQAVLNLIKNAEAAMPGGGRLTIRTAAVEGGVAITVADTGEGIPPERLSKIFEPYFTTKDTGSGLGLTLVFKIAREHGGEVTVASRVGEGSAFTITLPAPRTGRRAIGPPRGTGGRAAS